jgi:hypothetical protein
VKQTDTLATKFKGYVSETLAARFWPPVASSWIKANVYSAVASNIASLGLERLAILGTMLGDYAQIFNLLVGVTLFGITGLISGFLTGAVLKSTLPSLPMRKWIVLSGIIGVAFGSLTGLFSSPNPASKDYSWTLEEELFWAAAVGVFIGGAIGSLQAWVLRKAAHGLITWIIGSMSAFAIALTIQIYFANLLEAQSDWGNWLSNEAATFIANVFVAIVLLPAVARLKWRNPM